jgi:hypothetical protein
MPVSQTEIDSLLSVLDIKEQWQKTIMSFIIQQIQTHGIEGLMFSIQALKDLVGGQVVNFNSVDLKTASDLLAELQNMEADKKKKINDFITKVGEVLGVLLVGILRGIL